MQQQSDDVFCDMINSIQFLNMSKAPGDDTAHANYGDSGFNSGAELNHDNIFFYEDSCPSLTSCINMTNDENDGLLPTSITAADRQSPNHVNNPPKAKSARNADKELTQIQVNVGIDEDLKMILEMDPTLMDGMDMAMEPSSIADCPKILGLPPKM